MLVTAFIMAIAFAALPIMIKSDFWKAMSWIVSGLSIIVLVIIFIHMMETLPVVVRQSNETAKKIENNFLEEFANNVKNRFEHGNIGLIQQIKLANYCVSLLANGSYDIDYVQNKLSKIFGETVVLEYKTQYVYTPSIDEEDPRNGNFILKIGTHDAVVVNIW